MTNKPEVRIAGYVNRAQLDQHYNWGGPVMLTADPLPCDVALIRLTDHEADRAADKARIAELESALTELRDWYQDHTSLPACRANAALSHPKEPDA